MSHQHMSPIHPRGFSLVELMVGLTVALLIVAAATTMLTAQLNDQRRMVLALQVEQDLRATADLIARDVRRAGYSKVAAQQLPALGQDTNHYADASVSTGRLPRIDYAYAQDDDNQLDANDAAGIKLDNGVVRLLIGGTWQPLTDPDRSVVTQLSARLDTQRLPLADYCSNPCPTSTGSSVAACPPEQLVRTLVVDLTAHSARDPKVARSLHTAVRLRNDQIVGACAA